MKVRCGFVSNSSSSSFVVKISSLTEEQVWQIKNYREVAREIMPVDELQYMDDSLWYIEDNGDIITGKTTMDNFNMQLFMELIGVNVIRAKFEEDGW